MKTEYMHYFHRAAMTKNFTQAARDLFITTSALSKAIHSMEKELGVPLFRKNGRNVELTDHGRLFDKYVEKIYLTYIEGLEQLHRQTERFHGSLLLASTSIMAGGRLPAWMEDFRTQNPKVDLFLECCRTEKILDDLDKSHTHLGFCSSFDPHQYPDIDRRLISSDRICLLLPQDHPLAGEEAPSPSDLAACPFIALARDFPLREKDPYSLFCRLLQIQPRLAALADNHYTLVDMVRRGMGLALIPSSVTDLPGGLVKKDLPSPVIRYPHYMVWKRNSSLTSISLSFRNEILRQIRES